MCSTVKKLVADHLQKFEDLCSALCTTLLLLFLLNSLLLDKLLLLCLAIPAHIASSELVG
jgi:hypothetical protein